MNQISTDYLAKAEFWLLITTILYFFINGAQVFETVIFVPKWTLDPPHNFGLLSDGNGPGLKLFWIVAHSLHEISWIIALVFCWKLDPVRNWLLLLLCIHVAIRVWTLTYFAMEIIDFQKIGANLTEANNVFKRTSLWQHLNYVRVGIYILISLGMGFLCHYMIQMRH